MGSEKTKLNQCLLPVSGQDERFALVSDPIQTVPQNPASFGVHSTLKKKDILFIHLLEKKNYSDKKEKIGQEQENFRNL
jgi:hypothetical protein